MSATKDLNGNQILLMLSAKSKGFTVTATSKNPDKLFSEYDPNILDLKSEIEDLCDSYMKELGHNIHTSFTRPDYSFTPSEVRIIREYSI